MGKMKIGSGGETVIVQSAPAQIVSEEKVVTVEIPKPVTKDVIVEIPKPVYKIVEVEEVVKKPKIRVDEVTQSVIKPVFTIKQETIILDQLQKKLDESVALASSKLGVLNSTVVEQNMVNDESIKRIEKLSERVNKLQTIVIISAICSVLVALSSLVR
jgi:uncharacterized coiled-coil protein SlyX